MSTLRNPSPPELNDLSLLVLADLGTKHERTYVRINTLMQSQSVNSDKHTTPRPVRALEDAGLVEVRKCGDGYKVSLTDKGILTHRAFMTTLHNSAV